MVRRARFSVEHETSPTGSMREVGRPENLNKHITALNLFHESPVLRSANGPLPRSLCPRDKLHFSSYRPTGGRTIVRRNTRHHHKSSPPAPPPPHWQSYADFCTSSAAREGSSRPASVGYVTFPEQLFHPRTRTAPSTQFPKEIAPRDRVPRRFLQEIPRLFRLRGNANISALP